MEFSESDNGCKKHPNDQEKQGVCPSCLRERLSRLCSASHDEASSRVAPSLPLSPADYSSASPSSSNSAASPARHRNFHKTNGSSRVMGIMGSSSSSSFTVRPGTSNGLKKSRSLAFVPRNLEDEEEAKKGKKTPKKKNKGFWSKLVRFKEKKDVLAHSISIRLTIGRAN